MFGMVLVMFLNAWFGSGSIRLFVGGPRVSPGDFGKYEGRCEENNEALCCMYTLYTYLGFCGKSSNDASEVPP